MYISATSVICCNRGKRNNEKYEVISLEIWTKKGEKESEEGEIRYNRMKYINNAK